MLVFVVWTIFFIPLAACFTACWILSVYFKMLKSIDHAYVKVWTLYWSICSCPLMHLASQTMWTSFIYFIAPCTIKWTIRWRWNKAVTKQPNKYSWRRCKEQEIGPGESGNGLHVSELKQPTFLLCFSCCLPKQDANGFYKSISLETSRDVVHVTKMF